jgi:hypothetical protein
VCVCVSCVWTDRPVFRYERQGDDESYRVRPFIYSRRKHLATGDWETDVLWPLFHNACTHGSWNLTFTSASSTPDVCVDH